LEYIARLVSTEGKLKSSHDSDNIQGTNKREIRGEDVHIAKTLFIVISLFEICWFPTAIAGIVVVFGVGIPGLVQQVLMCTVCLAPVVNPIVYAIRNRRFRRTFKRINEMHFSKNDPVARILVLPGRGQVQTTL